MILSLVAALVARSSSRGRALVAAFLGWLVGTVLGIRRRHVADAMAAASIAPDEVGAFYRALAKRAVDLVAVGGGAELPEDAPRLTDSAREALETARANGPVVIAASHTGNWELAAFTLAEEMPLAVVAKRQGVGAADRFVREVRRRHRVVQIAPEGAVAQAVRALRAGTVVVMPIDQVPQKRAHAVRGSFLGRAAWLDRAPFVVAQRARATVLVAAVEGDRVHVLASFVPGTLDPSGAAARATNLLDAFVRAHPSSWLWLHRRWKELPARPPARSIAPKAGRGAKESLVFSSR